MVLCSSLLGVQYSSPVRVVLRFSRYSEPISKTIRLANGRLDIFGVETISAIISDSEFCEQVSMGVHAIKMVVQTCQFFNFLTAENSHGSCNEGVMKDR